MGIYGGVKSVCSGAVEIMSLSVLPALAEGVLSPQRVCDETFHLCSDPVIDELSADKFVERVIGSKPESLKNNDFVDNLYKKIKEDTSPRPIIRSVQFSDPHIDFHYQEGMPSECNFPICCRDNGPEMTWENGVRTAGKWGDYNCDVPQQTISSMFKFIAKN